MKIDFNNLEFIEITDAWLVNKETGERVLHLDQSAKPDASWASVDEFKVKYIKDKEGNFSLAPVMSQEGNKK